jgi:hypothetical protein
MKKIVLKYGLISGAFLGVMTGVLMPLCMNRGYNLAYSQVVGYSAMVLAFICVFLGIKRYRDDVGGGVITFGKAFQVGILIAFIASAMYVAGWEIAYWGFLPDFGDKYAAMTIEKMKEKGAPAAEIAKQAAAMEQFKVLYRKPLFNVGMTFLEVFPVGLIVTVVAAAILRKRSPDESSPATAAA